MDNLFILDNKLINDVLYKRLQKQVTLSHSCLWQQPWILCSNTTSPNQSQSQASSYICPSNSLANDSSSSQHTGWPPQSPTGSHVRPAQSPSVPPQSTTRQTACVYCDCVVFGIFNHNVNNYKVFLFKTIYFFVSIPVLWTNNGICIAIYPWFSWNNTFILKNEFLEQEIGYQLMKCTLQELYRWVYTYLKLFTFESSVDALQVSGIIFPKNMGRNGSRKF